MPNLRNFVLYMWANYWLLPYPTPHKSMLTDTASLSLPLPWLNFPTIYLVTFSSTIPWTILHWPFQVSDTCIWFKLDWGSDQEWEEQFTISKPHVKIWWPQLPLFMYLILYIGRGTPFFKIVFIFYYYS